MYFVSAIVQIAWLIYSFSKWLYCKCPLPNTICIYFGGICLMKRFRKQILHAYMLIHAWTHEYTQKHGCAITCSPPDNSTYIFHLQAKIQEMKEKELDPVGNGDVNSHVCKVCFESPAAAVLLPCRHFCCKQAPYCLGCYLITY